MDADPLVHNYFRHFEAPGVGHCYSASGLYPAGIFGSMVQWVEKGKVPDKLEVDTSTLQGPPSSRILCPHPQKSRYTGKGPNTLSSSYVCA